MLATANESDLKAAEFLILYRFEIKILRALIFEAVNEY